MGCRTPSEALPAKGVLISPLPGLGVSSELSLLSRSLTSLAAELPSSPQVSPGAGMTGTQATFSCLALESHP